MRKKDFTMEHLRGVCELYQKHLGGSSIGRFLRTGSSELSDLLQEIREHGRTEMLRVGSRYDYHTKLGFHVDRRDHDIVPRVNLNFDPHDRSGARYKEAMRTVEEFLDAAYAYLGVAR